MKKTLLTSIAVVLIAIVAIVLLPPADKGKAATRLKGTFYVPNVSACINSDSLDQQQRREAQAELDYYLERHNVQDEGYELVTAFARGERYAEVSSHPVSLWNTGYWRNMPREGTALLADSIGRIILGTFHADTLTSGIRVDTLGTYQGAFSKGKAKGHGAYTSTQGQRYEGHFASNQRNGFGMAMIAKAHGERQLKVGVWRNDKFLGERMIYSSERIYGIDISRYQHGKGRKKWPIQWQRVRISHLGSKSKKNVSGIVDYPVSFCFIKSTEGVSVRNRYYGHDYLACRRNGIPVGAYHFFSTRRSGAAQAQYFIKNTFFKRGDLPPVLDVEPSHQQIQQMGGTAALFRNIRAFLKAVEARAGVKPILYISQSFVKRYMDEAPDLKRDYNVWIARYGEYRPDVKLVVWQLSPDGRVSGIHGEVDINVFNGYQAQFEEFLRTETIR
ncbi:MAG: glycosyl hydrolase family 25 [Prevotella sp.]|nr:glycosyl hydrolase family 25 [Prevotella sp.]